MNSESPLAKKQETEVVEVVQARGERAIDKPVNPLLYAHSLLRGRYPLAVCLAIIGALIGAPIGYFALKPDYRSSGLIRIHPILPKVLYETEQNSIMPMFEAFLAAQVAELRGRRVIGQAMDDPEWRALGRGLHPEVVAEFEKSLDVTNPRGSTLIQVAFSDKDPKVATTAVKAVIAAYERIYADNEILSSSEPMSILETRRRDLEARVKELDDAILRIAIDYGSASLQAPLDRKMTELDGYDQMLRDIKMQMMFAGGEQSPTTQPAIATRPTRDQQLAALVRQDPVIVELKRQRDAESRELRKREMTLGRGHPSVNAIETSIAVLNEDIAQREAELHKMIDDPAQRPLVAEGNTRSTGLTLEELRVRAVTLEALRDQLEKETHELGRKNLEIGRLRTEAQEMREKLEETKRRIEHLNLEKNVSGRLQIMSRGDVPFSPEKDRRTALTALGGLGMAGVGVGFVMLLGFLDRRLREVDTTRTHLRQVDRLLGVLPEMPGDLVNPENASAAAYCVHHIRAMLQIRQRTSGHKLFAVTSPAPRDGKTSLVMTLGMSLAASGCRTLLIDADLDGQGLTSRLCRSRKSGESNQRSRRPVNGLFAAMRGEPLDQTIVPTGYPELFLLPMDAGIERASGQLAPDSLRRLLERIAPQYDTILIDSGPILGSVEAAIVATEADGIILVISRDGDRTDAERAANLLISAGADIEGIVFNRAQEADVAKSVYRSSASIRSVRDGEPEAGASTAKQDAAPHN